MVKSEMGNIHISGPLQVICSEVEDLLQHFYGLCVNNLGEETANELLAEIGRRAVMTEEEREEEHERLREEAKRLGVLEDVEKAVEELINGKKNH